MLLDVYKIFMVELLITKPDPNMIKILPIIPSSTTKNYHYSYFILIPLPIIPILFCINVSGTHCYLEKQELDMYQFFAVYIAIV